MKKLCLILMALALMLLACGKDATSPEGYLVSFSNDEYQPGDVYYFDFGSAFYEIDSPELTIGHFPEDEYHWIVSRRIVIDSSTVITALIGNGMLDLNREFECHTDGNRVWWE